MDKKECIKTCSEIYKLSQQAAQTIKNQGISSDFVISNLKQQLLAEQVKNKKLVEALEKISNGNRMTYCRSREALLFGCANKDALNINCQSCDYFIAQQALNEVNND